MRELAGQRVRDVRRRAKYLLIDLDRGSLIAHLGMSGSLRVMPAGSPRLLHDHYDLRARLGPAACASTIRAASAACSGARATRDEHPLLAQLGPEPLEPGFTADYLATTARSAARSRSSCS